MYTPRPMTPDETLPAPLPLVGPAPAPADSEDPQSPAAHTPKRSPAKRWRRARDAVAAGELHGAARRRASEELGDLVSQAIAEQARGPLGNLSVLGAAGRARAFSPPPNSVGRPAAARAAVSKEMRLFTRDGCPRLADVSAKGVEAWSGRRWIHVRPRLAPGLAEELYRVRLDDGSCLVCAAGHPWAVVAEGKILPVLTRDLRTDFAVSPFVLPGASDLGGSREAKAYELGRAYGAKMAFSYKLKDGLPARVFAMGPASLADFAAGWLDAQKGVLVGCANAMHDLQIVLRRMGVYHTYLGGRGSRYSLALSGEDAGAIPNPRGLPREFRRIVSDLPRVVEVYALGERRRPCTLEVEGGHTIVLDGVLTLC